VSCNAHNHPPDCSCGWGGVAYERVQPSPGTYVPHLERLRSSGLVRPNASCPVCGDAVYYYESPDGGRVFFDELAPPWPKHPCTDTYWERAGGKLWTGKRSDRYYRTNTWPELIDAELHNGSPISHLSCPGRVIYIRFATSLTLELAQINPTSLLEKYSIHISLLLYDPIKKEWYLAQGYGCTPKKGTYLLEPFQVTSLGRHIPENAQPAASLDGNAQAAQGANKRSRAFLSAQKPAKPSVLIGYLKKRPIR